ncbi:GNAT family N-acetyltransferase [Sphingobacterium tabacisoli]|uniref:GNAT family N-acetyltransferase n=1 Tax=Sphingobacterium tabacisoli TaxID=2044855 RepID=A0ABW5L5K5_9SPHI|nr:GNAT family N-acetyltransferase [Sphingobacterium tabacisoli]
MENTETSYSLKRMLPSDWEDYKAIRLEALYTDPDKFGSNYQKEAAYSDSDWYSLLENKNRAIFGLYCQGILVGLTGVALYNGDYSKALLFSSFMKEEHRGKGLSKLFYEERIAWAKQNGCTAILVSHRAGNEISKAANQRFGFRYTHSELVVWPDGTQDEELMYTLML